MSIYLDKLRQVQVVINCRYFIAKIVHLRKNTCPLFRHTVLDEVMSQSELTTKTYAVSQIWVYIFMKFQLIFFRWLKTDSAATWERCRYSSIAELWRSLKRFFKKNGLLRRRRNKNASKKKSTFRQKNRRKVDLSLTMSKTTWANSSAQTPELNHHNRAESFQPLLKIS